MNYVQTILSPMTDEDAMLRIKQGEAQELDTLFRRYSGPLFGYLYGMCRDAALCEDLVQEAFWRILRYRDSFDGNQSFRAWAYRIARNLLLDRQRRAASKAEVSLDSLEDITDPCSVTSFQQYEKDEDQSRLRAALDFLSREQREILVLARYEGLSFKEIGEICGCQEGTAKVRAFRALQALREQYIKLERRTSHE